MAPENPAQGIKPLPRFDRASGGCLESSVGPQQVDSLPCLGCKIAALPDGRLLVADGLAPLLRLYDIDSKVSTIIDLRNDVMSGWQARVAGRSGKKGLRTYKSWIGEIVAVTDTEALLLMSGPAPGPEGT